MDWYLLTKALHLISMVAWFAGLFYLPRLFVYAVETNSNPTRKTLLTMARKLYKIIMAPAMGLTWILGGLLILQNPEWLQGQGWLHTKLLLVFVLSGYQASLKRFLKQLEDGTCTKSSKFFRLYNEVPTLLLIGIILLAVFKPF